jgi:hypothetical protein
MRLAEISSLSAVTIHVPRGQVDDISSYFHLGLMIEEGKPE